MRALGPAIEDVNLSDTEEVAFASPDQRHGTLAARKVSTLLFCNLGFQTLFFSNLGLQTLFLSNSSSPRRYYANSPRIW